MKETSYLEKKKAAKVNKVVSKGVYNNEQTPIQQLRQHSTPIYPTLLVVSKFQIVKKTYLYASIV